MAVLINGESYSWGQIKVVVNGIPLFETKAISYNEAQEKSMNYGTGNRPTSYGQGRKTFDGSLTLSMADSETLRAVSPNRAITDLPPISIIVAWTPENNIPVVHTLKGLIFTEDPMGVAEGDTDISIELPFLCGDISR